MSRDGVFELSMRDRARGLLRDALHRRKVRADLAGVEEKNPILVYQMGKVGSSTVHAALSGLNLGTPVYQIHTLNPAHLAHAKSRQRSASTHLSQHLLVSEQLAPRVKKAPFPCRVISLTREPISRAISFVFEDMKKQAPDARRADGSLDLGRLRKAVLDLLGGENGIADPGWWFNTELRDMMGIDVFRTPYPRTRGYQRFSSGGVELLLIRLEDLARGLGPGITDLLGIDPPPTEFPRVNDGAKKWYAAELEHLKKTLKVDQQLLAKVLGTGYFRHFYSEDAEAVKKRWGAAFDTAERVKGPPDPPPQDTVQGSDVTAEPDQRYG